MILPQLNIKASDLAVILAHCRAGLPNESCGMLGGKQGKVEKVYPMRNAKPGPDYYEMEPEEQFQVMKDIRERNLDLIGLFHSHPTGQAYPSSVDVAQAYWPGTTLPNYPDAVYVIVSFMDANRPVARGFSIEEGTVNEVVLSILEQ